MTAEAYLFGLDFSIIALLQNFAASIPRTGGLVLTARVPAQIWGNDEGNFPPTKTITQTTLRSKQATTCTPTFG